MVANQRNVAQTALREATKTLTTERNSKLGAEFDLNLDLLSDFQDDFK